MFTTPDATPRRRKGRGKAMGHGIPAKVAKKGKLTVHGRLSETTVPGLIVRSTFIPRTHVSLSITHGKMYLPAIRRTYKIACR